MMKKKSGKKSTADKAKRPTAKQNVIYHEPITDQIIQEAADFFEANQFVDISEPAIQKNRRRPRGG